MKAKAEAKAKAEQEAKAKAEADAKAKEEEPSLMKQMASIPEEVEDDLRQTVSRATKRQASFERSQPQRPASKVVPTQ